MRRRLDTELVRRGLVASRAQARIAIDAGSVKVGGAPAMKAAMLVDPADPIAVSEPPIRFVSRGGAKLAAALERFHIDASGRSCLDAGASTGGFTDCLLQRGAARVIAVDVGYGQFDWRLRNDPRVTLRERTNVRSLAADDLPYRPDLVVADLSFISLRAVVEPLAQVAAAEAEFVLLVKPQFEAGREQVGKGGVVRDPTVWGAVLGRCAAACGAVGMPATDAMASPLRGPAGNVEFLLHCRKGATAEAPDLAGAVEEGRRIREAGR